MSFRKRPLFQKTPFSELDRRKLQIMNSRRYSTCKSLGRGIGVGVKGVAGRNAIIHKGDAIVHKRQSNNSHKELVDKLFPLFSWFRGGSIAQQLNVIELLHNYCRTFASLPATPYTLTPIPLLRKSQPRQRTISHWAGFAKFWCTSQQKHPLLRNP